MSYEARLAIAALRISITVSQYRKIRKQQKLIAELESKKTEYANASAKLIAENLYLYDLLEKHGVSPTQFDLIAINNIRSI